MTGYGVARDDPTGLLDWGWAEQRLRSSRNFWFVTVGANRRPHCMPVWGVWMPERSRWGAAFSPDARKVRNLAANDLVVVTNEDTVEVVSIEGRATEVTGADADALVEAWTDKYLEAVGLHRNEVRAFLRESTMWEVKPIRGFGMIERSELFAKAATRWVW